MRTIPGLTHLQNLFIKNFFNDLVLEYEKFPREVTRWVLSLNFNFKQVDHILNVVDNGNFFGSCKQ